MRGTTYVSLVAKVLALSAMDDEISIIRMLRCGAKGYVLKDSNPPVLNEALNSLRDNGVYINELVSNKMTELILFAIKSGIVKL